MKAAPVVETEPTEPEKPESHPIDYVDTPFNSYKPLLEGMVVGESTVVGRIEFLDSTPLNDPKLSLNEIRYHYGKSTEY